MPVLPPRHLLQVLMCLSTAAITATSAFETNGSSTTVVADVMRGGEYAHPEGVEAFDPYKWEASARPPTAEIQGESESEGEVLGMENDSGEELPVFLEEPRDTWVARGEAGQIRCRAAHALRLYFKCSEDINLPASHTNYVNPASGVRILDAEANVTRHLLLQAIDQPLACHCFAWSSRGQIKTARPAFIHLAYLKKRVAVTPVRQSSGLGGSVQLQCSYAGGDPPPVLSWLRNSRPLPTPLPPNMHLTADHTLTIAPLAVEDRGNYSCIAENMAGRRVSEPAFVNVYVNGGWSEWGPWSRCECGEGRRRSRSCSRPAPQHGGKQCSGHATQQTHDCSPCVQEGSGSALLAWVWAGVGGVLVAAGGALAYALRAGKTRDHSLYTITRTDVQPEVYPVPQKLGPDVTCHPPPPPRYDPPPRLPVPEHDYDVPHLLQTYVSTTGSETRRSPYTGTDRSTSSCHTVADSRCERQSEGGSSFESATSAKQLISGGVGIRLSLPKVRLTLLVGEDALAPDSSYQLHLKLLKDDKWRPALGKAMTQLSPVVSAGLGPKRGVAGYCVLRVPHCAAVHFGYWQLSLYTVDSKRPSSTWTRLTTLGHETIDTRVYTHIDEHNIYLLTDFLSAFVLVGESVGGFAVKSLKFALFGRSTLHANDSFYEVRLYIMEDTHCSLYSCYEREYARGSCLLAPPKSLPFQDGGADLCIDLDKLSPYWRPGPNTGSQTVPFGQIWNSPSNSLQRTFVFERTHPVESLEFTLYVNQKNDSDDGISFDIVMDGTETKFSIDDMRQEKMRITSNPLDSDSESDMSEDSSDVLVVEGERALHLCGDVLGEVCAILDVPRSGSVGADWRGLAVALGLAAYPSWFAARPSPARLLLLLWAATTSLPHSAHRLATTLHALQRHDAANIIEQKIYKTVEYYFDSTDQSG